MAASSIDWCFCVACTTLLVTYLFSQRVTLCNYSLVVYGHSLTQSFAAVNCELNDTQTEHKQSMLVCVLAYLLEVSCSAFVFMSMRNTSRMPNDVCKPKRSLVCQDWQRSGRARSLLTSTDQGRWAKLNHECLHAYETTDGSLKRRRVHRFCCQLSVLARVPAMRDC